MTSDLVKELEDQARDARRYHAIKRQLYWAEQFDVGEANVRMKVIGSCPTPDDFDAAIDKLQGADNQ